VTLSQTSGMDDNDYRTLAALRGRLYLALGRSKDAVAQFDRAIAPGGAQPADDIAELYELRSRAHAAVGNYPAAFNDQGEFLRRMREQGTLDRIREVAQLRVQFENDQEKQKIALLEKDKKISEERLNSQTRTTQLVAIAGLTGLVTAFFLGYALLSNRRHRAELIRLAERDELTGLFNRRAIVRKAVEFLSRARESKGSLVIGLIDLDHFKSINDRFGHAVGDQLLQRLAAALRSALHTREVFGRYGGEEFLVLFPDCTMEQARHSAERLRSALRDQHMRVDEQDVTVTLSLGLAGYESGDVLFDQVARRADIALYVAKTQGRDRVEIYNPRATPPSPSAPPPNARGKWGTFLICRYPTARREHSVAQGDVPFRRVLLLESECPIPRNRNVPIYFQDTSKDSPTRSCAPAPFTMMTFWPNFTAAQFGVIAIGLERGQRLDAVTAPSC
jgi:diguanylate cyclase (GGDEF)-like protein